MKGSTNWVLLGYKDNTHINVVGKGSGGADEAASHLSDDQVNYGLVRINFTADDDTTRTKFVFYAWAGPSASVLWKGKISVHKASIKTIFKDFAVELQSDNKEELSEAEIIKQVKRVNY